jgi:hypothetical protein
MSMENRGGMISTGGNLICSLEVSDNPTSRNMWQQARGMGKMNENLALRRIYVHTCKWFIFTCHKILRRVADGFTSLRKKACSGFLSPIKIYRLFRVWTREPWVQWQACLPLHHRGDSRNSLTSNLCRLLRTQFWFGYRCINVVRLYLWLHFLWILKEGLEFRWKDGFTADTKPFTSPQGPERQIQMYNQLLGL